MPTLVSTGQITITDTTDARTISLYLSSNPGTQQVFSKDESTVGFTPSWFTANSNTGLIITPNLSVAGLSVGNSWAALGNKQFALTAGGAALTTASTSAAFVNDSNSALSTPFTVTHAANGSTTPSTIAIKGNLADTVASWTLFFDADYTDPGTGLVTHITAQITLNTVKTGTNAVYLVTRGREYIEEATGVTKNVTAVAADLIRSLGVDTTGLTYKWYEAGGGTQISTSLGSYATKYGLKTTTAGTAPTGSTGELGVNVPASGAGNTHNTLVISETAIVDLGVFKVEVTDSDSKTFASYFTIYDLSDPYDTQILSSTGEKLQNGQGSTVLTPRVYNGSSQVTDLTGWSFTYYIYDKNGKRAAFVDTAKISTAGGATISANGTGASATIAYGGTSYAFVAGDIVKCVKPNGDAFFYEVASSITNQVTIRTPSTNTWLNFTDFPAPSANTDFMNGKFFGCTTQGVRTVSNTPWQITVTGDDIDIKGRILVESTRP